MMHCKTASSPVRVHRASKEQDYIYNLLQRMPFESDYSWCPKANRTFQCLWYPVWKSSTFASSIPI